jgi:hypothetical protein
MLLSPERQRAARARRYRQKHPDGRSIPNTGLARRIALDVARGLFFLHSRKCARAHSLTISSA